MAVRGKADMPVNVSNKSLPRPYRPVLFRNGPLSRSRRCICCAEWKVEAIFPYIVARCGLVLLGLECSTSTKSGWAGKETKRMRYPGTTRLDDGIDIYVFSSTKKTWQRHLQVPWARAEWARRDIFVKAYRRDLSLVFFILAWLVIRGTHHGRFPAGDFLF